MSYKLVAIIPAGGVGERAQHQVQGHAVPKQYRQIGKRSMLMHSVHALLADVRVEHVYIGVAASDNWISQEDVATIAGRVTVLACGGETRALTVLNTLRASNLGPEAWVMVHDAARPGLPLENLSDLITQCLAQQQGGLLALPVGDTVKRAHKVSTQGGASVLVDGASGSASEGAVTTAKPTVTVQETVPRDDLWLAQTPQLFKAPELIQALEQALAQGADITDEASAMEFMGQHPLLVKGHWRNLKVTWPSDFDLVEHFL